MTECWRKASAMSAEKRGSPKVVTNEKPPLWAALLFNLGIL